MNAKQFVPILLNSLYPNHPRQEMNLPSAPQQNFINECNFADEFRCKKIGYEVPDDNTIRLTWVSYQWSEHKMEFFTEIKRCCGVLAHWYKLEEPIWVQIILKTEDDEETEYECVTLDPVV